MQRAHGLAGRRPELVAQQHPQPLVGGERLGDLAARGQRRHQQPVAGLAQRRLAHQLPRGPLRGVGVRAAEREPRLRLPLERPQLQVVELGAALLHPRAVVAGQEPAADDRDRRRRGLPRRGPVLRRDRGPRAPGGRLRLLDVDLGAGREARA